MAPGRNVLLVEAVKGVPELPAVSCFLPVQRARTPLSPVPDRTHSHPPGLVPARTVHPSPVARASTKRSLFFCLQESIQDPLKGIGRKGQRQEGTRSKRGCHLLLLEVALVSEKAQPWVQLEESAKKAQTVREQWGQTPLVDCLMSLGQKNLKRGPEVMKAM